jgi:hypothetical protein
VNKNNIDLSKELDRAQLIINRLRAHLQEANDRIILLEVEMDMARSAADSIDSISDPQTSPE